MRARVHDVLNTRICAQVTLRMNGNALQTLDVDQYILRRASVIYRQKMDFYRVLSERSSDMAGGSDVSGSVPPTDHREDFLDIPEDVTCDYRYVFEIVCA